jgi:hypothetical protein
MIFFGATGIPLDKQGVLFKPFSQVSSHYARRHGGTGFFLKFYLCPGEAARVGVSL